MLRPLVILPSPLLPAVAYESLTLALQALGHRVVVAPADLATARDLPAGGSAQEAVDALIQGWAALATRDTILVAHSNAGYLAPATRARSLLDIPIIFVDAALPPATGVGTLAPPRFRAFLAGLGDPSGVLPPWTRWWPAEELGDVIPAEDFEQIDRSCPQLPKAYFDATVTAPAGWVGRRNAYLAFGDTYTDEFTAAAAYGWPCHRVDGRHLHFLHEPRTSSQRRSSCSPPRTRPDKPRRLQRTPARPRRTSRVRDTRFTDAARSTPRCHRG